MKKNIWENQKPKFLGRPTTVKATRKTAQIKLKPEPSGPSRAHHQSQVRRNRDSRNWKNMKKNI